MTKEVIIDGVRYLPEQHLVCEYVSFYFMHDNHTFTRLEGKTIEQIANEGFKIGWKSHGGMICPATIMKKFSCDERGREFRKGGFANYNSSMSEGEWKAEVNNWMIMILSEPEIVRLVAEGKLLGEMFGDNGR